MKMDKKKIYDNRMKDLKSKIRSSYRRAIAQQCEFFVMVIDFSEDTYIEVKVEILPLEYDYRFKGDFSGCYSIEECSHRLAATLEDALICFDQPRKVVFI